jgi:hypothetical protein
LPLVVAITRKAGSANPKITPSELPNLNDSPNWNVASWMVHAMA